MKLLALDSSTEACSAALLSDGVLTQRFELAPRAHTQKILPMIDELLVDSGCSVKDLDAIAFGRGPGSFTGLRICLGAVQGLAFGAGLPVIPVSTLAALAQAALSEQGIAETDTVIAAIDARMSEIYWAGYQYVDGLAQPLTTELLSAPVAVGDCASLSGLSAVIGVGSGWQYGDEIPAKKKCLKACVTELLPSAAAVVELAVAEYQAGRFCDPALALPTYLRDEVAWQKVTASP